jgi:phytoene dehydrogenase-like protein
MKKYDIAIIGGGHNGLVAASYLARAGKSVCVLEAREVVGGACVSEELIPGALWSSCSFIQGMLRQEIIDDLELKRFGLQSMSPKVQGFALWEDGDHFMLHQDVDETLRSIQAHSPEDGRRFFEFGSRLKRFADISRDWLLSDPPSRSEVFARFEHLGETDLLNEFMVMAAGDLLDRYFVSPRLKAYMTFLGMVSTWGGPQTPTTAHVYGYHAYGQFENVFGRWGIPVGGMGSITKALRRGAEEFGATVRTNAAVDEIVVISGRAAGVRLKGGELVEADIILTNAAPSVALGKLLPKGAVSDDLRQAAQSIDVRGSMARIHVLVDELPHYSGFGPGLGPQHCGHTILNATQDNYEAAADAQKRGEFPDDFVIEGLIHSVTDPSVCKPGQHTLLLGVQQLPFNLRQGTWDDHKEAWTDRVMETLYRFAPNLRGHVLGRNTVTPLDLERTYGLPGGNIFQRSMVGLENLFSERRAPGGDGYRTAVEGLYLCGAGAHPGGGVTGAPGHNAAKRVLADLSGDHAPVRRHTELSKSIVDMVMETGIGKDLGYQVAQNKLLRGVTRIFSKTR